MYFQRLLEQSVLKGLKRSPVTAILGPRQCGKSTLTRHCLASHENSIFLDLERLSDLSRLDDAEAFFDANKDSLICLDEVQLRPDLFSAMRSHADRQQRNGVFLITGSASPELLRQSAETLAGRVHLNELTPFGYLEVEHSLSQAEHLLRGGFPRSVLAESSDESFKWRRDFIQTFLERDIGQFGLNVPIVLVRRLWRMLAHLHGEVMNYSKLANALGVTSPTVKKYVDLLEGTFMIRMLEPYYINLKKRIIKSPKGYIRDTGILQALLGITHYNDLLGHPVYGTLWEGYVIENLAQHFPDLDMTFYRTSHGAEIDLVLRKGTHIVAIECKATTAPQISQGFHIAQQDIGATEKIVIAPVNTSWVMSHQVEVHSITHAITRLHEIFAS